MGGVGCSNRWGNAALMSSSWSASSACKWTQTSGQCTHLVCTVADCDCLWPNEGDLPVTRYRNIHSCRARTVSQKSLYLPLHPSATRTTSMQHTKRKKMTLAGSKRKRASTASECSLEEEEEKHLALLMTRAILALRRLEEGPQCSAEVGSLFLERGHCR